MRSTIRMNRQFSVSPEEALRKRFSGHRFVVSAVGLLMLLSTILLLIGSIISLTSEVCSQANNWLTITFPTVTAVSGVVVAVLYASSILGLAKKIPNIWVKVDLSCCSVISVLTVVVSILLLANCSNHESISIVPGVLGIVGAGLLIISCAIIFITWREADEDAVEIPEEREITDDKRKSVFI